MTPNRSIALLVAAVSLAGCTAKRPPGVYDVSVADAYQRLSVDELPDLVYAKQCGILIHVTPEGIPGQRVTWRVRSSGEDVVQFTAVLTPVGEKQTKVDIQIPADPAGGEVYDGKKFYTRPAFNQPLRPAVAEQVAAILEGRKFDVSRVGPGTDSVCNVQRGGLETGLKFRVDDPPGAEPSR
jgi:hypothetical protein